MYESKARDSRDTDSARKIVSKCVTNALYFRNVPKTEEIQGKHVRLFGRFR